MRRYTKIGLAMLAVGATALGAAPSALAQDDMQVAVDPVKHCQQVTVGSIIQKICVEAGTRKVIDADLSPSVTVAPYVKVSCPSPSVVSCSPVSVGVNKTGWETNPAGPRPVLIGSGVYMPAGNQGTLWVGGSPVPVVTPEICFGSDAHCPGVV